MRLRRYVAGSLNSRRHLVVRAARQCQLKSGGGCSPPPCYHLLGGGVGSRSLYLNAIPWLLEPSSSTVTFTSATTISAPPPLHAPSCSLPLSPFSHFYRTLYTIRIASQRCCRAGTATRAMSRRISGDSPRMKVLSSTSRVRVSSTAALQGKQLVLKPAASTPGAGKQCSGKQAGSAFQRRKRSRLTVTTKGAPTTHLCPCTATETRRHSVAKRRHVYSALSRTLSAVLRHRHRHQAAAT